MSPLRCFVVLSLIVGLWSMMPPPSYAEGDVTKGAGNGSDRLYQSVTADRDVLHGHGEADHWEGSIAGKTYSERNHWLAGILLLIIGYGEWRGARGDAPRWVLALAPAALMASGAFLLIWSDHDAWPIGRMTLSETFLGGDLEILQHKAIGLMAVLVGAVEAGRRSRWLSSDRWAGLLPTYAIVGGLLLLVHEHGPHPSGHQIDQHHTIMAGLAVAAGLAKGLTLSNELFVRGDQLIPRMGLEMNVVGTRIWASLIVILGLLLVFYRE